MIISLGKGMQALSMAIIKTTPGHPIVSYTLRMKSSICCSKVILPYITIANLPAQGMVL